MRLPWSSSRLCATWKAGDPVVLMGVTGKPTEISIGQTVLLIGDGLGNAVVQELISSPSSITYFVPN